MPKIINEIGNKYNNLIVIAQAPSTSQGRKQWICECIHCKRQYIYSGTVLRLNPPECKYCKHYGEKYNYLTIGEYQYTSKDRHHYADCICDCGNHQIMRISDVITGKKIKCSNCYKKDNIQYKDEIGNKYGKLTVLKKDTAKHNKQAYWICKCECGNTISVLGTHLRKGHTQSCGCIKSKGEEKIAKILFSYNVNFKKEVTFNDCYDKALLRFDFGIYNNNTLQYLIEYDGAQHYLFDQHGWNNKENYDKTKSRDIIKNQYCLKNNIPLIRIPYTILETLNIEDLKLETTKYLIKKIER